MLQGLPLLKHAAYLKFLDVVLHVTSRAVTLLLLCLAVQLSEKQLVPVLSRVRVLNPFQLPLI